MLILNPFFSLFTPFRSPPPQQKIRFEANLALNALALALLATFAGCWTNMLGKSVSEIIGQSVSGANQVCLCALCQGFILRKSSKSNLNRHSYFHRNIISKIPFEYQRYFFATTFQVVCVTSVSLHFLRL